MKRLLLILILCAGTSYAAVDSCGCADTLAAGGYNINTQGQFWAYAFTVPDNCSADSISFYAKDGGETGDVIYAGLYDTTTGGDIGALMDKSNDSVVIDGSGPGYILYTVPVSGSIGAGERQYLFVWVRTLTTDVDIAACNVGDTARREYYTDVNDKDTSITRKYYFNNDNYIVDTLFSVPVKYGGADTIKFGGINTMKAYGIFEMDSLELVGLNDTLDNIADSVSTDTFYAAVKSFAGITTDDIYLGPLLVSHNEAESHWRNADTTHPWNTVGANGSGTDFDAGFTWTYHMADTLTNGNFDISIDGHADSVITGDVTFMWGYKIEINGSPRNETVTLRSSEEPGTASDPYRQMKLWWNIETGLENPSTGVTADTTNYAPFVVLYYHTDDGLWTTDWNTTLNWHDAGMDWNND